MCLNKEGILSESPTDIHNAGCMPTLQHLTYNVLSAILKIEIFFFFIHSLPASCNFCHLLKTFTNSLDPGQARPYVRPDLDPNCLTLSWYSANN